MFSVGLWAQSVPADRPTGGILGRVKTELPQSLLGQPVELHKDTSLVKTTTLDSAGRFRFQQLPGGIYRIVLSRPGMVSPQQVVTVGDTLVVVELELPTLNKTLAEVVVRQKKADYEIQKDRIILNIESNPLYSGGSVLDALGKAPYLNVDIVNKTLTLDGLSVQTVLLNDKQVTLPAGGLYAYLASLGAGGFSRFEILTSPSARYDAAGGGVLLLYTKRDQGEGVLAEIQATAGFGRYEKMASSLNVTLKAKKLTGFLLLSGAYKPTYTSYLSTQRFGESGSSVSEQFRKSTPQNGSIQAGFDYQLSEKTTIGTAFGGGLGAEYETPIATARYSLSGQPGTFFRTQSLSSFDRDRHNGSANINVRHQFSANHQFSADLDYAYFGDNVQSSSDFKTTVTTPEIINDQVRVLYPNKVSIGTLKADYSRSIGKLRLETGIKYSAIRMQNTPVLEGISNGFLSLAPLLAKSFAYNEQTTAVYASLPFQIKGWSVNAGLRGESTVFEGISEHTPVRRKYAYWFPSLSASYTTSKKYGFTMSANRRIVRPVFDYLNPAYLVLDALTYYRGNPLLLPTLSTTFQVSLLTPNRYSLTMSYAEGQQRITQVLYRDNVDSPTLLNTYLNFDRDTRASLALSLPFQVNSSWQLTGHATGTYAYFYSTFGGESTRLSQYFGLFRLTSSLKLGQWLVSGGVTYRTTAAAGWLRYKPFVTAEAGLQRSFGTRSSLKIVASDLFHSYIITNYGRYLNTDVSFRHRLETQQVLFTYTYKLGHLGVKSASRRSLGSESELERARKE